MKVTSPAGDFDIIIEKSEIEGDNIVIKGQMGVWDTKIFMKPSDVLMFIKIFLKPNVLWFLIKLPFRSIFS